jgi:hypothetical protein
MNAVDNKPRFLKDVTKNFGLESLDASWVVFLFHPGKDWAKEMYN